MTQDAAGLPDEATPLPLDTRSDVLAGLQASDGTIPRPLQVALAFVDAVDGETDVTGEVLNGLVTPETRGEWDVDEASGVLADVGFANTVDELGDGWARVFLVRGVDEAYRLPADAAAEVPAYGLYLRYVEDESDWRVHRLATPDLQVSDLVG